MEGLIFGGAYLWREICVSKSIGLALWFEGNLPFLLFYFVLEGNEGFLRYRFRGLIFGGTYTWRGLFSEFDGKFFDLLEQ